MILPATTSASEAIASNFFSGRLEKPNSSSKSHSQHNMDDQEMVLLVVASRPLMIVPLYTYVLRISDDFQKRHHHAEASSERHELGPVDVE